MRTAGRDETPMRPTETTKPAVAGLKGLTTQVQRAEGFPEILAALKVGRSATVDGAWGSAGPLAVGAIGLHAPTTLLVVLAHVGDLDDFRDDVATLSGLPVEVSGGADCMP